MTSRLPLTTHYSFLSYCTKTFANDPKPSSVDAISRVKCDFQELRYFQATKFYAWHNFWRNFYFIFFTKHLLLQPLNNSGRKLPDSKSGPKWRHTSSSAKCDNGGQKRREKRPATEQRLEYQTDLDFLFSPRAFIPSICLYIYSLLPVLKFISEYCSKWRRGVFLFLYMCLLFFFREGAFVLCP